MTTPPDDRRRGWLTRGNGNGKGGSGNGGGEGGDEDAPMLVLGEDRPDVEDTTPEELARRAEEAEREIAAKKRAAEAEIAAAREKAERELAEQQREVDRRERELYREQRRLQRTGASGARFRNHGGARKRPASGLPPVHRRPLHQNWLAGLLSVGAAGAIVLAGFASGAHTDHAALNDFRSSQDAYASWQRAAIQLDDDITSHLSGHQVSTVGTGTASVERVKEAVERTPDAPTFYAQEAVDGMAIALDPATSPIRTLTIWHDLRGTTSYAHSAYDVERDREALVAGTGRTVLWVTLALAALAGLAALAYLNASLVAAGLALLAGLLAALVLMAAPDAGRIASAAEAHGTALDHVHALTDDVGSKLTAAMGLRSGEWHLRDEFWHWNDEIGPLEPGSRTALAETSEQLGRVARNGTADEVYPVALAHVRAAAPALEQLVDALEASRAELQASLTRSRGDVNTTFYGTVGGALAALAAFGVGAWLSARRGRSKDARSKDAAGKNAGRSR